MKINIKKFQIINVSQKKGETFYNKISKVKNALLNLVFRSIGCVNILNKDCADVNFQN